MAAVRWGMLSTAGIGRVVATAIRESQEAEFVAVAGRDAAKAAAYAAGLGVPRSFGSYDELLASEEVDAVYVPLPIALHSGWTIKALRAGKHVLCEKPLAVSAADAAACFDAADAAGRLCIEGLMWRHHPQTLLAQRLLADPWLCRHGYIELDQGDGPERLAADPTGAYQLGDHHDPDNDDAYRIEFDTASCAIATGTPPAFGRADAINQAATIEAVRTAAATGTTVTLPTPITG